MKKQNFLAEHVMKTILAGHDMKTCCCLFLIIWFQIWLLRLLWKYENKIKTGPYYSSEWDNLVSPWSVQAYDRLTV